MPRSEEELLEQVYRRSSEIRHRRMLLRGVSGFATFALVAGLAVPYAMRGGPGLPGRGRGPVALPSERHVDPSRSATPSPCACTVPSGGARDPSAPPRPKEPSPRPSFEPGAAAVLAFASDRDGNWEIYTANSDGSETRRLTRDPAPDREPALAPGGKRIAFVRLANLGDLVGDIYVIDADGTNLHMLTTGGNPHWSPDGARLLVQRYSQGTSGPLNGQIWLINSDGSGERMVAADGLDPAWAPDGNHVVFGGLNGASGITNVTAVALDGSGRRMVTNNPAYACQPDVSPDGRTIAYIALGEQSVFHLEVINWSGTSMPRQLTSGEPRQENNPSWSADGRMIAIARDPDGDPHYASMFGNIETQDERSVIIFVRSDGSGERQFSGNGPYSDADPAFAPRAP